MLTARFWEKVQIGEANQCWPWLANTCQGYGHFRLSGKIQKAHRLVYRYFYGEIPSGKVVMHLCDNRRCVNPEHLQLGSQADNNKDRDTKGRHIALRGEAHGMSRLTEEQARSVIQLRAEINAKIKDLAASFSVSKTTIRDVLNGKTWRWLSVQM